MSTQQPNAVASARIAPPPENLLLVAIEHGSDIAHAEERYRKVQAAIDGILSFEQSLRANGYNTGQEALFFVMFAEALNDFQKRLFYLELPSGQAPENTVFQQLGVCHE